MWRLVIFTLGNVIFFGALVPVFFAVLREYRRKKRAMFAEHVSSHGEMTDGDFLGQVGVPKERAEAALEVRRIVAKAVRIPVLTIHPSDTLAYLCRFNDDWDGFELAWWVGKKMGVPITPKRRRRSDGNGWGEIPLGELIRRAIA